MHIENIIWLPDVIDKLALKHHVSINEVEEIFLQKSLFRKIQKGHVPGENLYAAMGKTMSGRHLIVFFIYKQAHDALIISARDMDLKERRQYEKK